MVASGIPLHGLIAAPRRWILFEKPLFEKQ
jgi:hypothetical protein